MISAQIHHRGIRLSNRPTVTRKLLNIENSSNLDSSELREPSESADLTQKQSEQLDSVNTLEMMVDESNKNHQTQTTSWLV